MAKSTFFLLALIGVIGLVNCQFNSRDDRERELLERERERADRERLSRTRIAEGCTGKVMDIFFVLDSSSSIYINDYMSQHRLVRDIISRFDVSNEATRVGMLTFSDDLQYPVINLDQYNGKSELLNSITTSNLPYRTGVTNTDMAIRFVRTQPTFRRDITKVMIVMTDGGSRSPGSTAREAELARDSGFYMFVVGIGQYIEEREWRAIATNPDESFVFNITNARFLEDVQFSLPPRACALPPLLTASCSINRMSEVYFVASRSAENDAQAFIEEFGRRTKDQSDLLRANYYIDRCANVEDMQLLNNEPFICNRYDQIGNPIPTAGTGEMFSRALRAIRENTDRDTNHVVVLFADDDTMTVDRFDLANKARTAQNFEGATVVVADLGIRTYRDFAQRMASGGRNNFISFAAGRDLASQTEALKDLMQSFCNAANGVVERPIFSGGHN